MSKMTRYEKTRTISARTLQLSMGAPVLTKTKKKKAIEIAKKEVDEDALPIKPKTRDTAKR